MTKQSDSTAIHDAGLRHRFVHQKGADKAPVRCELLNKMGDVVGEGEGPSEEMALADAANTIRTQGRPKTKDEIIAEQAARIRSLEDMQREPPPSTATPPDGTKKTAAKDMKKQELIDLLNSNGIEISEDMKVDELRIIATEHDLAV